MKIFLSLCLALASLSRLPRWRSFMRLHPVCAALLMGLLSDSVPAQTEVPAFLAKLIAQYKAGPVELSPGSVWKYTYKGSTVYFVPRLACCDIMSSLYDANGRLLGHPDGGFTGIGDRAWNGSCRSFLTERSDGVELWKDPRVKD
jgi:hypothetical protein